MKSTAAAVILALLAQPAAAADVWLAGLDPVTRAIAEPGASSDFLALFDPAAPWSAAARKVRVLQVPTQFIVKGSDGDLAKTFAGLKARNIALAVASACSTARGTVAITSRATPRDTPPA
jgi:hypothetical protein